MQLTAVFERWHIGDGNYPPLHRGQLVNLSFQVEPHSLSGLGLSKQGRFNQIKDADYSFVGNVLKVYDDPPSGYIAVIEAENFRFYISSYPAAEPRLAEGERYEGHGRLLLDFYIWVEFLSTYKDHPDLFYPLRVTRIRSVKIPASFISRSEKAVSSPTSLSHEDYSTAAISEIERMPDVEADWVFYLVDFDDTDIGSTRIPLTFHSGAT